MGLQRLAAIAAVLWLGVFSLGCEQETPSSSAERQDSAAGQAEKNEKGRVVHLYNWENYIGENTAEKFLEATGIELQVETFEDEEAVLGALQSGAVDADLVVVSQSMAREMLKAKLLQAIDYDRIDNSKYVQDRYIPAPDQDGRRYWVPYLWGTTGIVVNTRHVEGDYRSWSLLWDPRYRGKLAMLNNGFEVTAAAAKKLGYSVNPTVEQLDEVARELQEQKELLAGYYSPGEIMERMADESIWAAQLYNGDGMVLTDEHEHIQFFNAREGMALWVDVFIIPRTAASPELAHQFLDFVHTPAILGAIAEENWFASTNGAAKEYISAEVLEAEEVYPPQEIIEKSDFFADMGSGESVRRRVQIWSSLTGD